MARDAVSGPCTYIGMLAQSLSTVDPGIGKVSARWDSFSDNRCLVFRAAFTHPRSQAYRLAAADMKAARPPLGYNSDHVARLAGEGGATAIERPDAVELTQTIHSEKLVR